MSATDGGIESSPSRQTPLPDPIRAVLIHVLDRRMDKAPFYGLDDQEIAQQREAFRSQIAEGVYPLNITLEEIQAAVASLLNADQHSE